MTRTNNFMSSNNINADKAISSKPAALYDSELKKEKNSVVSSNQITHVKYQYNGILIKSIIVIIILKC